MTPDPKNNTAEEWEAEDVEIDRPVSAVVSVRLPGHLAHRLAAEAATRGIGVSAFMREAVAEYLESLDAGRTSYDLSVSSPDVSVAFYAGRSVQGRTAGNARKLDEVLLSRS